MEFKIISHACLKIVSKNKTLIIDPWITEDVYNHAWSHFPKPVIKQKEIERVDYIYLTHWHFDHFHKPSLERFNKNTTTVLVPQFPVSFLKKNLEKIGFKQVIEIPHQGHFYLHDDFKIVSTQISHQDDSVIDIEVEGVILVNLNDAHPMPSAWRTFQKRLPRIDFCFRSHSSAWSYPGCFSFEDSKDRIPAGKEEYITAFVHAMKILKPKYAIPFASGVCHLHREVKDLNGDLVSPLEVQAYFKKKSLPGTELKLMPPGSTYSKDKGFFIKNLPELKTGFPAYRKLKEKQLKKIYALEEKETVTFAVFENYFKQFSSSLVFFIRPLLNITFAFKVKGKKEYWIFSFQKGQSYKQTTMPQNGTVLIYIHPSVLKSNFLDGTYANIDISKRWRVYVKKGGLKKFLIAHNLLVLYEGGYFSYKHILTFRFFLRMMRRYQELLDYSKLAFRVFLKKDMKSIANEVVKTD